MPPVTTCGTAGYTPPYAWRDGRLDADATWCERADRYALALLNVEFLILGRGAPLAAEGGIFAQEDLNARGGKSVEFARRLLSQHFPNVVQLFDKAIASKGFDGCPSPADWLRFCGASPYSTPPSLKDVHYAAPAYFIQLLKKRRKPAPLWPAPRLSEVPKAIVELPAVREPIVDLPPDPWKE